MFNFEFGAVNTFLKSIGLEPIDVYSNKGVWPFILIGVSAFKNVGYGTVMYLASIRFKQVVPPSFGAFV